VDRQCFDADSDPDQTLDYDADPDPGPTPSFRHVGKSEQKIEPLFSPVPVYCTLSFLSRQRHRCHFLIFWTVS
jgi:hypothetical protein